MTAAEAYETDSTFRALVDEWVKDRRCPRPLVDRCLELDMTPQSECARWASDPVRAPDLEVGGSGSRLSGDERPGRCGPYPGQYNDMSGWFWQLIDGRPVEPFQLYGSWGTYTEWDSMDRDFNSLPDPKSAILTLMDAWDRIGPHVLDYGDEQ